jgi:hypothetical protein
MVDEDQIRKLLHTYFQCLGDVEVQADGSVNASGDVTLMYAPPDGVIPVQFGIVDGDFRAENKRLKSLRNVPDSCHSLRVSNNYIQSLEYCPVSLDILDVDKNLLTNFEHAPEQVDTIFAFGNPLTSLMGLPQSSYRIHMTYRENLPLLRLVDAEYVHLGSPGPGTARLTPFEPVNSIINKYVGQGKPGAIKCAAELIKAGYQENARW